MPYLLTLFAGGTIPTTLGDGSVTVGPGAAQTRYVKLVNGSEWDALKTDEGLVPHVSYSQTSIIAGTSKAELQSIADLWHGKVNTAGSLTRVSFDGTDTHTLASRLTNVQDTVSPRGGLIADLSLTWESVKWPWHGSARYGTTSFPATTGTHTLTNSGNRAVYDPVITFTAVGGTVTDLGLGASIGGKTLSWGWAGTLLPGNALVIDCGAKTILNNGTAAYALTLGANHNSDSWLFVPAGGGSLSLTVVKSGGTPTFVTSSYDGWG